MPDPTAAGRGTDRGRPRTSGAPQRPPISGWAIGGFVLSLGAVALEVLGSVLGDSPTSGYPGWLVTITWPTALRALWWIAAAAGAATATGEFVPFRSAAARVASALVVAAPFAAFAVGIAIGAPWATWH